MNRRRANRCCKPGQAGEQFSKRNVRLRKYNRELKTKKWPFHKFLYENCVLFLMVKGFRLDGWLARD
jgi:hypothetical protein